MRNERVLLNATFDEKLIRYWMLSTQLILLVSIVTIPLMPIWLIFGWSFHRKQFERLSAKLTDRSLEIQRGYIFRMEKNVPLDRIQDLTMTEGPLLRWLGIARLHVETAGQNIGGGGGAHLVGVIDAPAFRDAVLDQRDAIAGTAGNGVTTGSPSSAPGAGDPATLEALLQSVRKIEENIARIADRS